MPAAPAPIHRWTLRFRDAALESAFRMADDARALHAGRTAALAGLVLALLPTAALLSLAPAEWLPQKRLLVLGAGLVSLIFIVGYAGSFTRLAAAHPNATNCVFNCVFAGFLATMLRPLPQEFVANRGFLFVALQVFGMYGLLRLRIVAAVVTGTLCVAVYIAVVHMGGRLSLVESGRQLFWLAMCNAWGIVVCYQLELASRREFMATAALEVERARAEGLLLNILPAAIAARLKSSRGRIAEHASDVTVVFADIVGFTELSERKDPGQLVDMLDRIFSGFDKLAAAHGLEKIKTIGDAYMAAAGLPAAQADHAVRAARMSIAMLDGVRLLAHECGESLQLRVGLHSGPVVAGVIGQSKFSYDLWGDTVNTASRMESSGLPDTVQCSAQTAARLEGAFRLVARGEIEIKGKRRMATFLVSRLEDG